MATNDVHHERHLIGRPRCESWGRDSLLRNGETGHDGHVARHALCNQAGAEKNPGLDLARPQDCILAGGQTHKADTSRVCTEQRAPLAIQGRYSGPKAKPRPIELGGTQRHPPGYYYRASTMISRNQARVSDVPERLNQTFKAAKTRRLRWSCLIRRLTTSRHERSFEKHRKHVLHIPHSIPHPRQEVAHGFAG